MCSKKVGLSLLYGVNETENEFDFRLNGISSIIIFFRIFDSLQHYLMATDRSSYFTYLGPAGWVKYLI